MTPSRVMDKFWRFKRVRDMILAEAATATRVAQNGDAKQWKSFLGTLRPITQEIDQPGPAPKPKRGRRIVRALTAEEMALDEGSDHPNP